MANSKRVKITRKNANYQYIEIDRVAIAKSQKSISTAMKAVIREYQKNEINSKELASKVALNS